MKFYLASPFFKGDQEYVLDQIEAKAAELGHNCFSPRKECLCPPNAPIEQRKDSFRQNCEGIEAADFVLARIDDFDPGTIWEIGFAYAKGIPVYAFTTVPGRGLNLMLAQSCSGFLVEIPSVFRFLEGMVNGNPREAALWQENII